MATKSLHSLGQHTLAAKTHHAHGRRLFPPVAHRLPVRQHMEPGRWHAEERNAEFATAAQEVERGRHHLFVT